MEFSFLCRSCLHLRKKSLQLLHNWICDGNQSDLIAVVCILWAFEDFRIGIVPLGPGYQSLTFGPESVCTGVWCGFSNENGVTGLTGWICKGFVKSRAAHHLLCEFRNFQQFKHLLALPSLGRVGRFPATGLRPVSASSVFGCSATNFIEPFLCF